MRSAPEACFVYAWMISSLSCSVMTLYALNQVTIYLRVWIGAENLTFSLAESESLLMSKSNALTLLIFGSMPTKNLTSLFEFNTGEMWSSCVYRVPFFLLFSTRPTKGSFFSLMVFHISL